jgi:excisionase family DNA binding protein
MQKVRIQPLNYSPDDAAVRLAISTRAVYTLLATGELKSFKRGKRRLIPDEELRRWRDAQLATAY